MGSVEPTGTVEEIKFGMEVIHGSVNTAECGKQPTQKQSKWYSLIYAPILILTFNQTKNK